MLAVCRKLPLANDPLKRGLDPKQILGHPAIGKRRIIGLGPYRFAPGRALPGLRYDRIAYDPISRGGGDESCPLGRRPG